MINPIKKVGLFCGQGDLPLKIIEACCRQNIPFFIIAFQGQTSPEIVKGYDHRWMRLGAINSILEMLKQQGISHVVLSGHIRRPSWTELKLDWKGVKWLTQIGLKSLGDDGLLSAASQLLEAEGYKILPSSYFVEQLLCPAGYLTDKRPSVSDEQDIERGFSILALLSAADIGQAVVVQQGLVLAVEAIEGTTEMIRRAGTLKRRGEGGVLVKAIKTNQNQKIDLPTIGPNTIHEIVKAGLTGIAVKALTTQVIDLQETIKISNQQGVFLIGVP